MAASGKDTIYIDIDDEITAIIDKVRNSSQKIVALVLPKRATVLQSVVNMKLLKRTADADKKNLVLITSEAGLMPLAASVGIHVARNLQSKPEIPSMDDDDDENAPPEEVDGPDDDEEVTAKNAGDRPVGELAAAGGAAISAANKDEGIETLEMDDSDEADEEAGDDTADDKPAKPKAKKNKKLAIPNFNKFRMLLFAGIGLIIVLIVGGIVAASVLPKATITLTTDTSSINSSLNLNLDSTVQTLDVSKLIVPAVVKTIQKSQSQQVNTTGQQNNGVAATGSVAMVACESTPGFAPSVPSGTPVTVNGLTFITQSTTTFSHSGTSNGNCFAYSANSATSVTAQTGGTKYNVSNATFAVYGRSDVSATGTTSGGTDNIIQIVAQADIDSATQKIAALDTTALKQQLQQQLQQAGLFAVVDTFTAGTPATTTSSNVGDQATTVTVTQAIAYTMFGVKESDLKTLVDNDVKGQIDPSKQTILNEGLANATFHVNSASATGAQVAMSTVATAGPDLSAKTVIAQSVGKKSGEVITMLKSDPGVTDVQVKLSPFWVSSVPKASKVTVVFQKAAK